MNTKPKIAILSLKNTYVYGGVLSSLKATYDFCQKYFDPTVFFLSFDPTISTSLKKMKFTSAVRSVEYFGMKGFEVGARWAFWEPGHYKFNLNAWDFLLKDYEYCVAVSGTCIVAHPFVLLNKKFGLVVSTSYTEDRSRRIKGLSWVRLWIDKVARRKMELIERSILDKADFVWALSQYSKLEFEKVLCRPIKNYLCCGHPVEAAIIPEIRDKDKRLIISVARFSDPRKNVEMLLHAFNEIYKDIPDAKLCIVGSKPDLAALTRFVNLRSFKNITFTGQIDANELKSLYARASLMLISSYQEGFGISGVEAMLNGMPVIATDCGGPADYVINGKTGYLVPINDSHAMAEYAISLLKNEHKLTEMSLNAQKFVLENYSTSKIERSFKEGFVKMYPKLNVVLRE